MIGEVLTRCLRIPGVDEVVCAIPTSYDGSLQEEVKKYCRAFRDSEHDVLRRFHGAAAWTEAEIVMRITGDCPLICPELCGEVLSIFKERDVEYASNIMPRTFPKGLDCEVFTMQILENAHRCATDLYDREHVTPWIQRSALSKANVALPYVIEGRLCIDTEDDYKVIKAHFDESRKHLHAA